MKKLQLNNLSNNKKNYVNCKIDCNIVTIKKLLGNEIKVDARRIQVSNVERRILNNNELFDDNQNTLFYQTSDENHNDVILQIKANYFGIPEYIQINQNSTIQELKNIFLQYSCQTSTIFLFDENGKLLENDKTIFSCNLFHDYKIMIWRGNNLKVNVNVCVPLPKPNSSKSFSMIFSVTEQIKNIKTQISEKLNLGKILSLALFTDLYYLHDSKVLVDYPFRNEGSDLYFLDLIKNEEINKGALITKGKYSKIFKGEFGTNVLRESVSICQYSMENKDIEDKKILKYEIISRLILCNYKDESKSNDSRFVEFISMYEEEKYFYIVTKFMKKGSVRSLYKVNPLSENNIIHYSIQICEAIQFMHNKKLIHRTLTCSSALVDDNNNIKLTNFHFSKYLENNSTEEILDGIHGSSIETKKCWLAPEVLREEIYGLKADIWSLGATMIEMVTRARPYPDENVLQATLKITTNDTIVYNENIFPQLNPVIMQCLNPIPSNRPTAAQCLELLQQLMIILQRN